MDTQTLLRGIDVSGNKGKIEWTKVSRNGVQVALIAIFGFSTVAIAQALVNDRQITIRSSADVVTKRQALIEYIWGSDGFPRSKLPSSVDLNVPSPVDNLNNLERVDTFHIALDPGDNGLAHHFIPRQKNSRLVILHHGHACAFNDNGSFGLQPTINALLSNGFSVLTVYMPHERPGDCGVIGHDTMFSTISIPPGHGSVMKFFLESTAASINYLKTKSATAGFPVYRDFNMIGLSGGGWTTTVYAAIDPRITLSFPVAGSIPLYLRSGGSVGDTEQNLATFYQIAGYPDLYVLGSYGAGRKQIQILNRFDDCCFGQNQDDPATHPGMTWDQAVRDYESRVQAALTNLGAGSFRLEIDDVAPRHMISTHADDIILSELLAIVPFSSFSASAEIEGRELESKGSFTLGPESNGINPPGELVAIQIDGFGLTIPAGSFVPDNDGAFEFKGAIGGIVLEMTIQPVGAASFSYSLEANTNVCSLVASPANVTLAIGNSIGTTSAIPEFDCVVGQTHFFGLANGTVVEISKQTMYQDHDLVW